MAGLSSRAQATIDQARKREELRSVSQSNPVLESLPAWVEEFRPHQVSAVEQILEAFQSNKVVVLDAPTGSGKTLIAECVRRILRLNALYICTTKGLQDQFLADYSYAKVLKGRANYPTEKYAEKFHPGKDWGDHLSCEDCLKTPANRSCKWCVSIGSCPYERAKNQALSASLAVVNTSYFLAEANNVGRFSNRPFVIADEADLLENALMGYVSVEISERRMNRFGWDPPKKVTVAESWAEWLDKTIPKVQGLRRQYPQTPTTVGEKREASYLSNLSEKLSAVRQGLDSGIWVYTGDGLGKGKRVSFRPSRVDGLGQEFFWKHSSKFLMMSATIISASELLDSLGYQGDYELVRVPSTFPIENRKVRVLPVADLTNKTKDQEWPKLVSGIDAILARHPDVPVLVHTVSFNLARYLLEHIQNTAESRGVRPIIGYLSSVGRDDALRQFLSERNGVLIAASMDRGIDLPGDKCRVQVIAKVPYPYLGDRQVSARLHSKGGNTWYTVQTVRSIVQMSGRAIRSKDDWAVTYITDKQFQNGLWRRARGLFPKWWSEAIEWRDSGR